MVEDSDLERREHANIMSVGWLPPSYRRSRGQGSEGGEWQLLHMLTTGRGRGLDRVLGELLVLDILVYTT